MSDYAEPEAHEGRVDLGDWLRVPAAAEGFSADRGPFATYLTRLSAEFSQDRWLYVAVIGYAAFGALMAGMFGFGERYKPFLYVLTWLEASVAMLVPGFVIVAAAMAIVANRSAPLSGFLRELKQALHPRIVAGLVLFCATVVFYGSFTSIKNMLPDLTGFTWDKTLADVDQALHFGVDPTLFLGTIIPAKFAMMIDFFYGRGWSLLMLATTMCAAVSTRYAHLRTRYFMTYFICWIVVGNLLAGLFLSGGPCYYALLTGDYSRFADLPTMMLGTYSPRYQQYLWNLYQTKVTGFGTGISAFPSMHLATVTLIALYLWSINRSLGIFGIAFTLLILIGSIRLGWHYAIDGYVAILVTLVAWKAVGWAERRPAALASTSAI